MKKAIIALGILFALLVGTIIILPVIYKDKIVTLVKTEINNNINAKADFKDFGLTLFSSFPDFTLNLHNFSIVGINEFEGDTLTSIKQLAVTVDLLSVLGGDQLSIEEITLEEPLIHLLVLKNGKANWDIAKASVDSTPAPSEPSKFKAALKKYSIDNGDIIYNDESLGFKMTMDKVNHSGKGDFTQDLFVLSTNTTISATNLWYGGVKYLHQIKTFLKADLDMDMKNMKFTFKENELALNELMLGFDGWLAMPANDISLDFKFNARQNDFKNFISMIPGVYSENFKDLRSKGSLALNGFVKGIYNDKSMPGFGLTVNLKDGMFQYPTLPTSINNVQMNLNVINPDGVPDHTAIDLTKLHIELGSEPFDARLRVRTPVSDADLDGMIKGKINFASLGKVVPLEQGTSLKGQMNADLSFKGRMSAIEQKRYEDFNASGVLSLADFNYTSKDYQQGFDLKQCALTFNPRNVTLDKFDAKMGKSDFRATGSLDNLLAYVFKNEVLKGTLNLSSNLIDLNEFASQETTATTSEAKDTSTMSLVEVPANIDFTMATAIGKIIYDNMTLENVKGNVVIRNQIIDMTNLSLNMLQGSMLLTGSYATPTKKKADMKFSMNIKNFDIQQTVKTFNTVKKMAPIAEKCNGKFSTTLTLNGALNQKMEPDMKSLNGKGTLQTGNVSISNFTPLVKLGDALKLENIKQVNPSNLNISFEFVDGRIYIKPFETTLAGYKTKIEGSNGFDQTIDYTLNLAIPTKQLPSAATNVVNGLFSQANKAGANLSMGDNVNVNVLMGGTVNDPKIKTGLKETTGKLVDSAKEKAKEELDKKKKELEDKAKAEAERLKKEAESKAKAEADKLKKEAEDKINAEKERLKKEAEKQAKDKLKNLLNKPK